MSDKEIERRISSLPSKVEPCSFCGNLGDRRFFVACKLPKNMAFCDVHYKRIRAALEEALTDILREVSSTTV